MDEFGSGFGFDDGDAVIVTGGGSGIGRATARAAAAQGLLVHIWDLDERSAASAAEDVVAAGGAARAACVDVTDPAAVSNAFVSLGAGHAPPFLVNNAGPPSSTELSYANGLVAAAGSVELVTERWLELDLAPGASVVNVSSVAGNVLGTSPSWYAASKAAIAAYTRYLAVQQAARIRANAVAPGLIATPRMEGFIESEIGKRIQSRIPRGRMGRPEDIAWLIVFLLSPRAAYVTGDVIVADGGWTRAQ